MPFNFSNEEKLSLILETKRERICIIDMLSSFKF